MFAGVAVRNIDGRLVADLVNLEISCVILGVLNLNKTSWSSNCSSAKSLAGLVELVGAGSGVGLVVGGVGWVGIMMLLMLFMPIGLGESDGSIISNSFKLISSVLPHSSLILLSSELDASENLKIV